MRVLFIIPDGLPTFRPDVSSLFGKYLPRFGIRSDVVTVQNSQPGRQPLWTAGEAYLYVPTKRRVLDQFGMFLHICSELMRCRKTRYDAIVVRDRCFSTVPALICARMQGIAFIYWMSFPMAESYARLASQAGSRSGLLRNLYLRVRGSIGRRVIYGVALRRARHVFVQSDAMKRELEHKGVPPNKMTPVPMCVDPDRFSSPVKFVSMPGRRVVGYLGTCDRWRRIDFLFEALVKVRQNVPNVLLIIAGDAVEEGDRVWLRQRVRDLGLTNHVTITGWLSSQEALEAFQQVEVALALMAPDPLLDTTSPTKLVEYLAMGRAVVANDHPDHREVLTASRAGVVTAFDVDAYSQAVTLLLQDASYRDELASRGRGYVLEHRSYVGMAAFVANEIRRCAAHEP